MNLNTLTKPKLMWIRMYPNVQFCYVTQWQQQCSMRRAACWEGPDPTCHPTNKFHARVSSRCSSSDRFGYLRSRSYRRHEPRRPLAALPNSTPRGTHTKQAYTKANVPIPSFPQAWNWVRGPEQSARSLVSATETSPRLGYTRPGGPREGPD
jgi:hypothetical protein